MPIVEADLKFFLAASRPTDDESTSGGARSATARPLGAGLTPDGGQFSAAARPEIVSDDEGDTANVTITGRLASGELVSEVKALDGTTPVLFDATFERIHTITLDGAADGTVTVAQGTGGTVRHQLLSGELVGAILFINAVSDAAATRSRYEKAFGHNGHGSLSLLDAEVELITDSSDLYEFALAATKDDTVTVADRLTEPAGSLTFVGKTTAVAVPDDVLGADVAIGIWVHQALGINEAAGKDAPEFTLRGNTVE